MYRRRKKNSKKKYIIAISIFVVMIFAIIVNLNPNRNLTFVEKYFKDGILYVEKIIKYPFNYISELNEKRQEKKEMYNEYSKLKEQIESYESLLCEKEELEKQLSDLKKLMDINSNLNGYETINATVINRSIDYFSQVITIDKGSNSGILVDMPVTVGNGLIGKITQTTNLTSTVQLLTHENPKEKLSIKIKLKDKYVYGLLVGYNKENKTYKIEGISENDDIEIGSYVTTTGLGNNFPSGILIGKVKGVTTDNFDLTKIVEVETEVDFDDLTYVKVLKRNDLWLLV